MTWTVVLPDGLAAPDVPVGDIIMLGLPPFIPPMLLLWPSWPTTKRARRREKTRGVISCMLPGGQY